MLVYANSFLFEATNNPNQLIQLIAKWAGQRSKTQRTYVEPELLAKGVREFHLKDGSTLSSRATIDEAGELQYPYLFCASLSHGDPNVPGRRWTTEIGIRREDAASSIECSILLKTDEVSTRVNTPIQVSRPRIVQLLAEECSLLGPTPGCVVKQLDIGSAPAFLREVEHIGRAHPLILISADRAGKFPVDPGRLCGLVVGLAEVVTIPAETDTFSLEEEVGRRYIAFGGSVNIIFPLRHANDEPLTVRLRPEQIATLRQSQAGVESEILATITHRTNLRNSWRHISPESVSQAILRARLNKAVSEANGTVNTEEVVAEYVALLEEADRDLQAKDLSLKELRAALDNETEQNSKLLAHIDGLKYALTGRQAAEETDVEEVGSIFLPLRQAIIALQKGDNSLEEALTVVATLFSDRLIVLDTAYQSAKDSDFRYGQKAFDLLLKLVGEYWQILADGNGDQQAKAVFGQNAYAANEGGALSNEGKRRRTFKYKGRDFLMERHVKHGVKDSSAETLRIHFEWLSGEKKLVIGHCGAHLDF